MPPALPAWAQELKELFVSGAVGQFILYGNVFDVVPWTPKEGPPRFLPLKRFLEEVMLEGYDTVVQYDRGKGIRVTRGDKEWSEWLSSLAPGGAGALPAQLGSREPARALELMDLFVLRTLNLQAIRGKDEKGFTRKVALILDFAQFIVPRGEPLSLAGDIASNVVKVLSWANDPAILSSNIVTFLVAEKLSDLSNLVADNPHAAKIEIKLPSEPEVREYLGALAATQYPKLEEQSDVGLDVMARRLAGLSRIGCRNVVAVALGNGRRITTAQLGDMKKETIEKECQELLEFVESPWTLENVSGHAAAKEWLRQDIRLLREGRLHALPMGYLITGRIGTGKTFLVQCWAGELGVPCVVFKNFRDKWVGSTEGKLEKIFQVLHALGQVVIFVDEADQMTGKRDSGAQDSGLSGRIYAMLAREMSDTANRGRMLWVFATSRPDLVEVDLKRQGRLDVHVPLFPPQSAQEYADLFLSIARKLRFPLAPGDVPPMPAGADYGGNEVEGMMVRALRMHELDGEPRRPLAEVFARVMADMKPNAYTKKLEYMDLIAVKECTDARFLPERYARLTLEEVERRIEELRRFA